MLNEVTGVTGSVVLAAALAATAANAQIIADGSFEVSGPLYPSPASWVQASTFFGTPLCNPGCALGNNNARTGQWWAWFGGNAFFGPEHASVTQGISLPAGSTAVLTFYLKADSQRTGRTDFLRVLIDGQVVYTVYDEQAGPYSFAYLSVAVDLSAFAGARRELRFESHTLGTDNLVTNFFVDDVSIVAGGCYANCDGSTVEPVLNIADYICFQASYSSGHPAANCDGSTVHPVLNIGDFLCFQSKYVLGCNDP